MALETTAENLNKLVAEITKYGANVPALLAAFDEANNPDNNVTKEKLFDDGEKSVNKFHEELFGKKAEQTTSKFLNLVQSKTGLRGATEPSPLEIKKKVGFEKDEPNPWIKKVDSTKLKKEEAQKFFYQRLLLSSFEDKDIFVSGAVFNDELHTTFEAEPLPLLNTSYEDEVSKDSVKDLWLYAKFNELKEEKEIPQDYEYKAFVGLVRKSIEEAGSKNPVEKVTTKTIVDDLISENLSENLEELKKKNLVPKFYNKSLFSSAVRKEAKEGSEADKNFIFNKDAFDKIIIKAIKEREPEDAKAAIKIQKKFRGSIGEKNRGEDSFDKEIIDGEMKSKNTRDKINDAIKIRYESKDTGLIDIKLLKRILEERTKKRKAKTPEPAGGGANSNAAPGGGNSAGNDNSAVTEEMRKILGEMKTTLNGAKSSDPTQSQWQADGTKNITYQYLVDNNYVSNGENHYLIPEIRGREPGAVTQYTTGLPVFNYKDLKEFSQDAAEAGKGEWDKNDKRLLSSIVCIGEGEDKRYCVVTSSVRGITKAFISQTEFNEITSNAALFYDFGLESAIKTTALDETLEVLNSAKNRFKGLSGKEGQIEIINNEIAAIEVRNKYMENLMKGSDDSTIEERLSFLDLYNNLDITLPKGIDFTEEEKIRFEAAKSRTVVVDDSYNTALEVVLKMDAAYEIACKLEEAQTRHENEQKNLMKERDELSTAGLDTTDINKKIAAATLAIDGLKKFIDETFNEEKVFDKASFQEQKDWSLTEALKDVDSNSFLNSDEKKAIKEFSDKAIDRSKDTVKKIAEKLTSANPGQIDCAQKLADEEFGIKTGNRKEKLEKASDKEKEAARHSASCSYSHEMAKTVERSIENEVINGLDTFEVTSVVEDMVNKHASKGTIFYQSNEAKEEYAKAVRKTCKAPVPHTNVNGVGFHRPRGTSIVSVGFSYNGVGREGELTGNTEAYVHIDGSNQCYIGCRVCPKDGMNMSVLIDGKADAKKEYKRGDTAINQNTISFFDPKTKIYTHVEASPSALKAHLKVMKEKGNPYPGSVETIMAQYKKMQIKVTSQVNNAKLEEEPDIERKVSIMHKGNTLSYNADEPKTTIGKKKVVTKAIVFDQKGELIDIRPGFEVDGDSKVLDKQEQFVKINEISLPNVQPFDLYVKLSTNSSGEVIHDSTPYIKAVDGTKTIFKNPTLDDLEAYLKSSGDNKNETKDNAKELLIRAENECKNTKLIVPLGEGGKEYKISNSLDFTGVGIVTEKPSNSIFARGGAIKLGNVDSKLQRTSENIEPSLVR